jgi:hypothetical protein
VYRSRVRLVTIAFRFRLGLAVIPTVNSAFNLLNLVFIFGFNVLQVNYTVATVAHIPSMCALRLSLVVFSQSFIVLLEAIGLR